MLFYGAANRDPRQFDDPERFDVRRDPNAHVGFGGPGPHFCLGAHLARRELSVVFRQLLTRLPDIEVSGDPVPLDAMGIPLVGGIKRLPVRFTPTAPIGAELVAQRGLRSRRPESIRRRISSRLVTGVGAELDGALAVVRRGRRSGRPGRRGAGCRAARRRRGARRSSRR